MKLDEKTETYFSDSKSIKTTNTTKSTGSTFNASISFNNFISNNKHFFMKLGLEDLMNDPIFKLKNNEEAKPENWSDETQSFKESIKGSCINCNESFSGSFFKKYSYCKYCGSIICPKCTLKLPSKNNKQICNCCLKKFNMYEAQINFKSRFETVEIEIKEASQSAESVGIRLSESSHEIERIKALIEESKRSHKDELSKFESNKIQLKKQKKNCDSDCIELTSKINALIEEFKKEDDEFHSIESNYKQILSDREDMYKEFIASQDKLNKLNRENQELSVNLQGYSSQISKRIIIDFTKDADDLFGEPLSDDESQRRKINESSSSTLISHNTSDKGIKGVIKRLGSKFLRDY